MKLTYIYSIIFSSAVLYSANGTEPQGENHNGPSQNTAKLQEANEPTVTRKKRVSRATKVNYESGSYGKPLIEGGKTSQADSLNNK